MDSLRSDNSNNFLNQKQSLIRLVLDGFLVVLLLALLIWPVSSVGLMTYRQDSPLQAQGSTAGAKTQREKPQDLGVSSTSVNVAQVEFEYKQPILGEVVFSDLDEVEEETEDPAGAVSSFDENN